MKCENKSHLVLFLTIFWLQRIYFAVFFVGCLTAEYQELLPAAWVVSTLEESHVPDRWEAAEPLQPISLSFSVSYLPNLDPLNMGITGICHKIKQQHREHELWACAQGVYITWVKAHVRWRVSTYRIFVSFKSFLTLSCYGNLGKMKDGRGDVDTSVEGNYCSYSWILPLTLSFQQMLVSLSEI